MDYSVVEYKYKVFGRLIVVKIFWLKVLNESFIYSVFKYFLKYYILNNVVYFLFYI